MFGSLVPPSEVDSAKGAFNCPQKLRNMERAGPHLRKDCGKCIKDVQVARMNRAKKNRIIDRGVSGIRGEGAHPVYTSNEGTDQL
jgi:hypothetical protein